MTVKDMFGNRLMPLAVTAKDPSNGISMTRVFHFAVEGDDTGIINLKAGQPDAANAPVYDLQGRRTKQATQKGVYIQGGKKFVVK